MAQKQPIADKCHSCRTVLRKYQEKIKSIATEDEVRIFSKACNVNLTIGSVLCGKCRLLPYRQPGGPMRPIAAVSGRGADQNSPGSQSSQGASSTSQGSGGSSLDDPSFNSPKQVEPRDPPPVIEMPYPRVIVTHKYCFVCGATKGITTVPLQARREAFSKRRLFIPENNRCCQIHLIKKKLYEETLEQLRPYSNSSLMTADDLKKIIEYFTARSESTVSDRVGDLTLPERDIQAFTGLSWENVKLLSEKLTSMRDSQGRNKTQALVTFLTKLRTGNSNALIASILGLQREQQVSDYVDAVATSFERDVLPKNFGINDVSRETILVNQSTVAKKLLNLGEDEAVLIFDGTYVTHQKSTNNDYQRRSYSGQKKKHLAKPFTICTTNGFVVDTLGPFPANLNDAQILEEVLKNENGLKRLLKPGDYCIVDRGFRDVVSVLEGAGYRVLMPALKGKRKQLTTEEANNSRKVTKLRWPVEAVHGIIGQRNKLLHHQLDNKLLPKLGTFCRIVSYIHNTFSKRLESDEERCDEILRQMESRDGLENTLAKDVEEKHWSRRKLPFRKITSSDITDFPELTEADLKLLFTGSYQLKQSVSYLAEIMDKDNEITLAYVKETRNILRVDVPSRHIRAKTYKCFLDYVPDSIGVQGIRRYCCDCANGNRTIGCCSHVAAIVYYFSHARYLSRIVRPAEILSKMYTNDQCTAVINEDSDDD